MLDRVGPAVLVGHTSGCAIVLAAAVRGLPVTRLLWGAPLGGTDTAGWITASRGTWTPADPRTPGGSTRATSPRRSPEQIQETPLCPLIAAGVPCEYRLLVFPRVLGRGRRLVPDGVDLALDLVGSRAFSSGVTLQAYRPPR